MLGGFICPIVSRGRGMKILLIVVLAVAALFAALWALVPLVAYSLLTAILAPVLSGVAFVANLVLPTEEKRFRIEVRITLDGTEHRPVGIATCQRLYETYGPEGVNFGRRLKISGGHVTLALPDRRRVESSAFLVCSEDEFAKVKDSIAFYLIDRRALPIRAQYTSVPRSAANPAAPFRVSIVSAGPTNEAGPGRPSYLPEDVFAVPRAIEDVASTLTSYIALPIPKEVWSTDERLRVEYGAITEFSAVRRPSDEVVARLVTQTDAWPASGVLAPDHSRVDLPAFGPPVAVGYVVIETRRPRDTTGPPVSVPGSAGVPRRQMRADACEPFGTRKRPFAAGLFLRSRLAALDRGALGLCRDVRSGQSHLHALTRTIQRRVRCRTHAPGGNRPQRG